MNLSPILGPLVEPVGLLWLASLGATVYLIQRRHYRGALFPAAVTILLWGMAGTPLAAWLMAPLERPYAPVRLAQLPACDAVVSLGGGVRPSRSDPLGFDCTSAADRFFLSLELVRMRKAPALVLGGGHARVGPYGAVEVPLTQEWLKAWGLNAAVFELGTCANTRVEAERFLALAQQQRWQRVLLVTSAWHMKRAQALFSRAGVAVVPVACDFRGLRTAEGGESQYRFLRSERLEDLGYYLHEQLGALVYRWRGWI
jgi:uncharacterized SAM-binding protein YcdF (DUF218 family)